MSQNNSTTKTDQDHPRDEDGRFTEKDAAGSLSGNAGGTAKSKESDSKPSGGASSGSKDGGGKFSGNSSGSAKMSGSDTKSSGGSKEDSKSSGQSGNQGSKSH